MQNTTSAFFPQQQNRREELDTSAVAQRQPTSKSQISSQGSALLCGTAHGSAIQSSSLAGGRGLRFPSSRRYLWDRTPAGSQVLINTQEHVPHVQVAISAFGAISRALERQTAAVPLQCGISVTFTNQVTALVQELDPLVCKAGVGDLMQLQCPLVQKAEPQDTVQKLQSALQAQIEQRNSARMQQLYAFSATAAPEAAGDGRCCLQLQLLMPNCSIIATPLYAKRLCQVPLAEAILKPGGMSVWQSGYLSMDQARSLLPLEATDPNVYSSPLVGVWVKGPSSVMHPLVAMACLRFAYSSLLADRAVNPGTGAFLLLLCPEGDPVSKCFEMCFADTSSLQLGSYQYSAALSLGAGMAQYPGGLVKAERQVSDSKPAPLPGNRIAQVAAAAAGGSRVGAGDPAVAAADVATSCSFGFGGMTGVPHLAVGNDSPVLMLAHHSSNDHSSRGGLALPAARSSAPTGNQSSSYIAQRHAAAVAAWRSLPLTVRNAGHAGHSPAAVAACIAYSDDAALPQPRSHVPTGPYSSAPLQYKSAAAAAGLRTQEQQRQWVDLGEHLLVRPSARTAGSPAAAAANNEAQEQQQQHWAQLGEPSATVSAPLHAHVDSTLAAIDASTSNTSWHTTVPPSQQQQQQGVAGGNSRPGTGCSWPEQQKHTGATADADCAPRLGSPVRPYKQQQQQQPSPSEEPRDSSAWAVHEVTPASPSVRAGVALSNLALLQQLSTGQLQAAIEKVMSPNKTPQWWQQQQQQSQQQLEQRSIAEQEVEKENSCNHAGAAGEETEATERSSRWAMHEVSPVAPSVTAGRAPNSMVGLHQRCSGHIATDNMASPTTSPQQQQADGVQWEGVDRQDSSSTTPQVQGTLQDRQHCIEQYTPMYGTASPAFAAASRTVGSGASAAAESEAASAARHGMQSYNAGSTAAAAALEAATAAVQRMPPSPYGKSLGVQRYAADVAALCDSRSSQECSVAVAGAWASTGQTRFGACSPRAAAMASPTARSTAWLYGTPHQSHPSSAYSLQAMHGAAAAAGTAESTQLQQRLQSSLDMSAAAAVGAASSLDAAGEMLRPFNAPGSALAHQQLLQQQQQQLDGQALAPAWHDPVAQALQGEVQQLRQELAKLQQQLRKAGMPDATTLELPPLEQAAPAPAAPTVEPPVAAVQATAEPMSVAATALQAAAAGRHVIGRQPTPAALATADIRTEQPVQQQKQQASILLTTAAPAAAAAAGGGGAPGSAATAGTVGTAGTSAGSGDDVAAAEALQAVDATAGSSAKAAHSASDINTCQADHSSSSSSSSARCHDASGAQAANAAASADAGESRPACLHVDADNEGESPTGCRYFSPAKNLQPVTAVGAGSSSNARKLATAPAVSCVAAFTPAQNTDASVVKPTAAMPAAVDASSPDCSAQVSKNPAVAQQPGRWSVGSLQGSGGQLRASLDVPPLVDVVRTKYCQLSDDSDDSDHEFEEKLMLKYGLKHR